MVACLRKQRRASLVPRLSLSFSHFFARANFIREKSKERESLGTRLKESYVELKKALKGRFEPEALKERHLAQFQARKKTKTEDWAEFADAVKLLCDKAYPDLEEKARECLALNHYLGQIDSPQIAFSVRQRQPKTLMDAVSGTIEMESYLQPKPS